MKKRLTGLGVFLQECVVDEYWPRRRWNHRIKAVLAGLIRRCYFGWRAWAELPRRIQDDPRARPCATGKDRRCQLMDMYHWEPRPWRRPQDLG